jgi:tetratricopeptide (TPR) repeat protein
LLHPINYSQIILSSVPKTRGSVGPFALSTRNRRTRNGRGVRCFAQTFTEGGTHRMKCCLQQGPSFKLTARGHLMTRLFRHQCWLRFKDHRPLTNSSMTNSTKQKKDGQVLSKPVYAKPRPIDWRSVVQALIIVAAGLWIYWPALQGGWLSGNDDDLLVTHNYDLRSLQGLWEIWFTVPKTDYWPLTWTLLWMEWHLWGNDPLGYHICNLALHLSSGFLIWRLFNRLGLRYAWLGGLLFVVHPLAVESVAWVSEIKNTLSLPLFLLSLNAWLDTEETKSGYLRSVIYYLAAMLAKTSTVMLPLVLLLYCWWKHGHVTRQELKRMIPYVAIALPLSLMTVFFQNEYSLFVPGGGFIPRLIGAGPVVFFYLEKFILPINLLPVYPRWTFNPPTLLEVLAIPALAGALFYLWTRRGGWGRHALFGFGFFLLNLVPFLGLVKFQHMNLSLVADHFAYLPMIGLIGLIVAGLGILQIQFPASVPYPVGIGTISIVLVWLSMGSHNYAMQFHDSETLATYTLQHSSQVAGPHNYFGSALLQSGRVPEAIEQFKQALKIEPDNIPAHVDLGDALLQAGRMSEAIEQYKQALKIIPDLPAAHNNLGRALLETDHVPEAIEQFKQALKVDPYFAAAHNNLGVSLRRAHHVPEAIEQFKQALKLYPDFAGAHNNLGIALSQMGHVPEAIKEFEQALKLKPDFAAAHNNLGRALLESDHVPEAIEQFKQALKIEPDFAAARNNLAAAQVLPNPSPANK